jgi:hypothetical protein
VQLHKGDFGFRTPTVDEFRFATATAILGGARGIGMWAAYRMNLTWAAATLPPLLTELGHIGSAVVAADTAQDSIVLPNSSLVVAATAADGLTPTIVAALYRSNAGTSSGPWLLAVRAETAHGNATVRYGGPLLRGFTSALRVRIGRVQSRHSIDGGFTDQMGGLDVAMYRLE